MGFNLMAALGGAGRAASENMAARQLQMDKIELIDTELETRNRLKRSEEREAENKLIEERTKYLKSLNYSDAEAAWIVKGGADQVQKYADYAVQAMEKGIEPSTLIQSPMINTDHQDPRNESAMESVIREADDFTFEGERRLDTGVLGEVLRDVKEPTEYTDLAAGFSAASSRQINAIMEHGENSDEAKEAQKVVDFWAVKIATAPEKVKTQTKWYSDESRGKIVSDALKNARNNFQIPTDQDGQITQMIQGKDATLAVALLKATQVMGIKANPVDATGQPVGVTDTMLMDEAAVYSAQAFQLLRSHADKVVKSTIIDGEAYGKKFTYMKNKKDKNGNFIVEKTFVQAIEEAPKQRYKVGDTVIVDRNGIPTVLIWTDELMEVENPDKPSEGWISKFYDAGEYFPNEG